MPIRNLTERPRMPRLGKIHLGVKKDGARGQYPKAVDHFVCPDDLLAALKDKVPFCDGSCGETPGPVELPVMFMSNDAEKVAGQWFRSYKATVNLVCKGDGYRADALLDRAQLAKRDGDVTAPLPVDVWASHTSKEMVRTQIDCLGEGYDDRPACPMYAAKACKRLMMLQFAIPDAPGLGVYQLDTSSAHSILNVNGFLEMLTMLTRGRIAGIPLVLRVQPQQVTAEGKKKTVYVLALSSRWNVAQLSESLERPVIEAMLPAPDDEIPEDQFPEEADESAAEGGPARADMGTESNGAADFANLQNADPNAPKDWISDADFNGFWRALGPLTAEQRGAIMKAAEDKYGCRWKTLAQTQLDEVYDALTPADDTNTPMCNKAQSKKLHTLLGKYKDGDVRLALVVREFPAMKGEDGKLHTSGLSKDEASKAIDLLERMEEPVTA